MKGFAIAIGIVVIGAICWAEFGEAISSGINNKLLEMQASFSNSLQNLTTPHK